MAAPKKPGVVRHLHIDPYVRVIPQNKSTSYSGDKRLDKTLAWFDSLPPRQATKLAWELIIAACNGELGVARQDMSVMADEDEQRAEAALEALLNNMSKDDE